MSRTPRFVERVYTLEERAYCDSRGAVAAMHFAARFAAKEATVKALGLDGYDPLDIEVVVTSAAPRLALHGSVAERAAQLGVTLIVSLTHVDAVAAAVVLGTDARGSA
jgi:holo-[acyl-carrier protein] synthase